jgi:phosphoglycolate phosphatase
MSAAAPRLRAALCDLDGTLLDTAPDLAAAVNRMLAELHLPARSIDEVAADNLFARCYDGESGRVSRPFPGVLEGLEAMSADGMALACVTNKPRRHAVPLLARTGLEQRFQVLVCGDDVKRLKPDPLPYLEACRRLSVQPVEAVVIGDSDNDVEAARAAGCRVICVPYGYREGRPVSSLQADALVPDLCAAAAWMRRCNRETSGAGA